MFRVNIPGYPYPCFFVEDPRTDERFTFEAQPVIWVIEPSEQIATASKTPAFQRLAGKGSKQKVIHYEGIVGRSREQPDHYLQVPELKDLDRTKYQVVVQPLILRRWDAWLRIERNRP